MQNVDARSDGGIQEAPPEWSRVKFDAGHSLRMHLSRKGDHADNQGDCQHGNVADDSWARAGDEDFGCGGKERKAYGGRLGEAGENEEAEREEAVKTAALLDVANPGGDAQESEKRPKLLLARGYPSDGFGAFGVAGPKERGQGADKKVRSADFRQKARKQGDKQVEENCRSQSVQSDVYGMVGGPAGAEERNIRHVGNGRERHPYSAVSEGRESGGDIGEGESILDERAAVCVAPVVEAEVGRGYGRREKRGSHREHGNRQQESSRPSGHRQGQRVNEGSAQAGFA